MKEHFGFFLKGLGIGIANIIPGVSGGTIALIVGIYERLIDALKSFGIEAAKLLFKGEWKQFAKKTDLYFLLAIFAGVGVAIVSLARLFDFLFNNYPVYIWSFFFGLILISVYYVGRTVEKWTLAVYIVFIIGAAIAIVLTFLTPASENSNFYYLIICGVVAICSMILPGLSGSFVLILMGNYQLIAITAINERNYSILLPVMIGAVGGLVAFSHLLSWVFKKYKNETIALLTGFIFGSLGVIWPWKHPIEQTFGEKIKVVGYDYFLPQLNVEFFIAILVMLVGIVTIWYMEKKAMSVQSEKVK
jgi:putative membrane protein